MGSKDTKISKLYEKAHVAMFKGEHEDAIKIHDKILKLNPSDNNTWVDRGFAFLQLEKFEESLESYNKALEINLKDTNALFNKGIVLSKLERFEESAVAFKKYLEIEPQDFQGWGNYSFTKLMLGQLDEAKKGYLKNIELNPSDSNAFYNLACIMSLQNQAQDALEYLEKAVHLDEIWSENAKDDEDFDNIRNMDEFQEILKYQKPESESPLQELRHRLMEEIEPSELKIVPSKELPRVWAIIVDIPIADTWVSLICIAEGSVSLYFGNGGGIVGAGEHESVWIATKKYLMKAEEVVDKMGEFNPVSLEGLDKVTFHVLMHEGRRTDSAKEEEMLVGENFTDHYLSELYHLAQDVITEIRLKSPGPE